MAKFGERLKQARLKAGKSQEDLANDLGVKRLTVIRWENGSREPTISRLSRLCAVLEVSCDSLLELAETNRR